MNASSSEGAVRWVGPRWLGLGAGVLLILLGASLVLKPFASLAVLILLLVAALVVAGVAEFLRHDKHEGVWGVIPGIAYLLATVLVLAWPGATIRVITLTVACALLVGGVSDLVASRRVRGTARFNAVIGGTASIVFGLLALAWPDVTLLVIGVVFGARMISRECARSSHSQRVTTSLSCNAAR